MEGPTITKEGAFYIQQQARDVDYGAMTNEATVSGAGTYILNLASLMINDLELNVVCSELPGNKPLVIQRGQTFKFTEEVMNNRSKVMNFDIWIEVKMPGEGGGLIPKNLINLGKNPCVQTLAPFKRTKLIEVKIKCPKNEKLGGHIITIKTGRYNPGDPDKSIVFDKHSFDVEVIS